MMTTPILCLRASGKMVVSGSFMAQLYQHNTESNSPVAAACATSGQTWPVTPMKRINPCSRALMAASMAPPGPSAFSRSSFVFR